MTASGASTRRQLNDSDPFEEQLPQRLLVSRTPIRAIGLQIRAAQRRARRVSSCRASRTR